MSSSEFWLSEAQFRRLEPLLPRNTRGVPRVDDRRVISGIVHVTRSGLRWRDAAARYGPHKTLYNRFVRWSRAAECSSGFLWRLPMQERCRARSCWTARIWCLPNPPPFSELEPASAVRFDPDLTGEYRVKLTWSATFGGERRTGGDFGAHIADFWRYRAWRAAGSPDRAALARFPDAVRQRFVAGT